MSLFRLLAALRRLVRQLSIKNEFSSAWHRQQERDSWQSDYQGPTWQATKIDLETWKGWK